MFRLIATLALVGAFFGCAVDPKPTGRAHELEYEGPVYIRDCSETIDSVIENWKPEIAKEVCALTEEQLEGITIGPIGPLNSSDAAKLAYQDFRRSCTDLKGQRDLLEPEEVNQFIKDSVLSALCAEGAL